MSSLSLPLLHSRFNDPERYRPGIGQYQLLPLRFIPLDSNRDRYVVTSFAGDFVVMDRGALFKTVRGDLKPSEGVYDELITKHMITERPRGATFDLLATQYRTRQSLLAEFTGLHLFVVTLRCDHSCPYCQVSRVSEDREAFDMSIETADRAIALALRSPSHHLKIEFQGGEPLLNFPLIRHIVESVKSRCEGPDRRVTFVIATNLALISDEILAFCHEHSIQISTSLDGPRELHNRNRPRPGSDSYERTIEGIRQCREVLGHDQVSALMTTTRASLDMPEAIIDEYVEQGFDSIFLRWMSPYGFASRSERVLGYREADWNRFYERGLRYILDLNRRGISFRESYACIVLRKMLTPFPVGYVDLQSPTGLGLAAVAYNYDGDVYASDESRMLAEVGDRSFRMGNVHEHSYEDLFRSEWFLGLVASTMTEAIPQCSECAFEPFCGTDPVFHHATQGDPIGHRPTSAFCARNMFVFRLLIRILTDEPANAEILSAWGG